MKTMLLSNCHDKFIFPLVLAVEGFALGLIFFSFSFCLLFHDAKKILVLKQIILFWNISGFGK